MPADKQEVEHLRSEVTRLRNHIDDMGCKISQLTSLVEALAIDREPPAASGVAVGRGIRGSRSSRNEGRRDSEKDSRGNSKYGNGSSPSAANARGGAYDSFVFGVSGMEDMKFSPPADPAAAAVLPEQRMFSRKRKLIGLGVTDCSGGEGEGFDDDDDDDCCENDDVRRDNGNDDDGDLAMPWPSGIGECIIKTEIMDQGHSIPPKRYPWAYPGLVKQESVNERYSSCSQQWPNSDSAPSLAVDVGAASGSLPTSDAGSATASNISSPDPAAILPPQGTPIGLDHPPAGTEAGGGSGGDGGGHLTLYRTDSGFSDQFLSFGSPTSATASCPFPDRGRGVSAASCSAGAGSSDSDSQNHNRMGDDGGEGHREVDVAARTEGGAGADPARSSSSCPADYVGAEAGVDMCDDGVSAASSNDDEAVAQTAEPSAMVEVEVTAEAGVHAEGGVSRGRSGASHMEDLQNNLGCLQADSKTKVGCCRGCLLASACRDRCSRRVYVCVFCKGACLFFYASIGVMFTYEDCKFCSFLS